MIGGQRELRSHFPSLPGDVLVGDGLLQPESPDLQVTFMIDGGARSAAQIHSDVARIGAGSNDEVVFQSAAAAVVDEVDSGVHAAVTDPRVIRNVGMPLRRIV